jgi:hypothetical protein
MDDALPPLQGGCLCDQVRYEATPTHRDGYYCHCRMCQLAFGNTRAAFFNLRKDQVRWLNGPPAYYASSKIARRGFCGRCGTPLSFEFLDSENMDLSVGSLDDPAQLRPTEHFGVETRIAAWHVDDGLPGSRLDANANIMQRWRSAYCEGVEAGLKTLRQAGGTMAAPSPDNKDSA